MKKLLLAIVTLSLVTAGSALAWDADFAAKADKLLGRMDQQTLSTSPCKIAPEKALEMMRNGEEITLLDVRTPAEMGVVGLTWKKTLRIPLDELFKPENLDRLPKTGKLVLVCHSGNRAAAAAVLLRAAGIDNAVFLNGGLIALSKATTPPTAPRP